MSSLADREKIALLEIARHALVHAVTYGRSPVPREPVSGRALGTSSSAAGAFVTVRCQGKLRGCIGQIGTGLPLEAIVAHCAVAAATDDPRFRSLEVEELGGTHLEISVLSEPEVISPESVVVGKHGLIINREGRRGLLLPQVAAQYNLTVERFLEETCAKAGLPRDAWKHPDTQIQSFTADIFSERESDRAGESAQSRPDYSSST